MAREVDIVHGPLWRRMAAFVLPIMAGTLFQQLYYYVDAMVVGHVVGATALGAVDSTQPVLGLSVDFFVGLCTGATVVISQLWGAHDNRRLSTAVHTALAFAFVAGLAITVVCLPLAEPILRFMNTPPENMGYALSFIRVQLLGIVFMMVYNMGASILRAVGDSRRPFYFLVVCSVVNIALELLFVAVFGWGVAGAAWATLLAIAVSAVLVVRALCSVDAPYRVTLSRVRFDGPMLRKVVGIGLPTGVQMSMFSISNMIIQTSINECGSEVVSAFAVCGKCSMVMWLVLDAFALASTTFMGQCYGAGEISRAKRSPWVAIAMCCAICVPLGVFDPRLCAVDRGPLHRRRVVAPQHPGVPVAHGAGFLRFYHRPGAHRCRPRHGRDAQAHAYRAGGRVRAAGGMELHGGRGVSRPDDRGHGLSGVVVVYGAGELGVLSVRRLAQAA